MRDIKFSSWLMWGLTALFFAYQFVLRVSPSILMHQISEKFGINATAFGVLASAYYIGYSTMQIPIGILLDKYGPRFVVSGCILICVIGNLSFVYTDNWQIALIGRFLIGVGSAAGILGASKIIFTYFQPKHFSYLLGITFTVGLLGAVNGGVPTSMLSEKFGWENVLLVLSGIGLLIAIMILTLVKNQTEQKSKQWRSVLVGVLEVINTPKVVMLAICGGLLVGPLEAFADVWGVQYLIHSYNLDKITASKITSMIYLGMCFGGPVIGYLANQFKNLYLLITLCSAYMAIVFVLIIGLKVLSPMLLLVIMFVVGIACCYQIVVFTIVSQLVPTSLTGIATSFTNMINMLAGTMFHLIIGWVMDLCWSGELDVHGLRLYEQSAYHYSMLIIPITLVMGISGILILNAKKTKAIALRLI